MKLIRAPAKAGLLHLNDSLYLAGHYIGMNPYNPVCQTSEYFMG